MAGRNRTDQSWWLKGVSEVNAVPAKQVAKCLLGQGVRVRLVRVVSATCRRLREAALAEVLRQRSGAVGDRRRTGAALAQLALDVRVRVEAHDELLDRHRADGQVLLGPAEFAGVRGIRL